MSTAPMPNDVFHIAAVIFPGVTQLDFTGPLEVFQRVPGVTIDLVWKDLAPIHCAARSPKPLRVLPSATFADISGTDLLLVPGGPGVANVMVDRDCIDFLQRVAPTARYVTSVCTGALILAAAGLLRGYRTTTHWAHMQWLAPLGAVPVHERVVMDRNRITGAGVSSGTDFALRVVGTIWGDRVAQSAQLSMEYDPQPPYDAGSPSKAPEELVSAMRAAMQPLTESTGSAVAAAVERQLQEGTSGSSRGGTHIYRV